MLRLHPEIPYVFLIGGFGCGKSFTDVMAMLWLYNEYKDSEEFINIGVFGVTIKLLKQTVIADFERFLDSIGISYRDNSQQGILKVGNITFIYLQMQNPDDIYAFNFHCAICDEIDEVPAEKVKPIVTAIQERCRKTVPRGKNMPERSPFILFTTTAQGLGGTYRLVEEFKKNKVPYAIIRGRTQDNPNLDPEQLKLLRKLYTADEARAYLDGEFMNLTNGRVYPMFDRRKCLYMPFRIRPGKRVEDDTGIHYEGGDTIYVGQDFNKGFNASVECIERGGQIFVINAHHWDFVGHAAQLLREMYPNNRIVMIPDASGKEIMSGFVEEFEEHNIEIYWNSKNPSVTERIMAVNKLMMFDQLKIFNLLDSEEYKAMTGKTRPDMDKLVLGLETRDFDDNSGEPRKGKGPEALDHHCDALEYAIWRIIHGIKGFEKILKVLSMTYHRGEQAEAA